MGVESERGPVRRTVLLALPAALAATALAACTSGDDRPPGGAGRTTTKGAAPAAPSADDLARRRAVATTRELLARVTAATGLPAAVRDAVAAGHRAHLAVLGAPGAAPSPSATSSPSPARPTAAAVVSGEADGARQALADLAGVGRETATVLVRIAAARAAHADVVARAADRPAPGTVTVPAAGRGTPATATATTTATTGPAAASPTASLAAPDVEALSRLVEAEHAAVFGYAVVVPRVAAPRQDLARRLWDAHRSARDVVEASVVAAGAKPPAALPAYALDVPASAEQAVTLAARIEGGLAAVAVWSAGRGAGPVRARAADLAVAATRDQARWLGTVPPFTT